MFTLNLYCHLRYCLQLLSPVYLFCCLHMLSFSQCEYFSTHYCTIVYIKCLHWIFTVTYDTVYNYSPQYTYFAVYICFPFTMRIFFHSYCIIFYSTMFTVRLHLIHAVLLQLVCALYIHTFPSTMIMFKQLLSHNTAIKIRVNVQRLHTVLFTITLPSTRTVLFIYAFLFTMWIFSTHYCTIIYMTMFTFVFPLHYVNIFLNYTTIVYIQCWN